MDRIFLKRRRKMNKFQIESDGNKGIPIFSWCEDIEESALAQIANLAHLPFAYHHIAVMPDCLTSDTEVLTDNGWRYIRDITVADSVASVDINSGMVRFTMPTAVINRELKSEEKVYKFSSTFLNKSITCTEKHRMAYKKNPGIAAELVETRTILSDMVWNGRGVSGTDNGVDISYEMLCLIAWTVADGSIKGSNKKAGGEYSTFTVRFSFGKQRKIDRVKELLDALGFSYNTRIDKGVYTTIEVHVSDSKKIIEYVTLKKEYPTSFIGKLSNWQADVFIAECLKADGDFEAYMKSGTIRFNSSRRSDIDFLSAIFSSRFGNTNIAERERIGFGKKSKMFYCGCIAEKSISDGFNGSGNTVILKSETTYSGNVVCLTVETGFFLARQNGLTFVSGNCHAGYGMPIGGVLATKGVIIPNAVGVDINCSVSALKTNIKASDLSIDTLKEIMGEIRKCVPFGEGQYPEHDIEISEYLEGLEKELLLEGCAI
jgi:hypothetical protein